MRKFSIYILIGLSLAFSAPAVQAVTGGAPAAAGEAPWMVGLVDLRRPDNTTCTDSGGSENFCKQFCGGVLISSNWVLTAAHCVDNSLADLNDLVLIMDGQDLNAESPDTAAAAEKIVHISHFVSPSFDHDIALLRLTESASQMPASIVESTDQTDLEANAAGLNDELHLFGYGRLSSTGDFASDLQQVALDLQTDAICDSLYNSPSFVNYYGSLMLCAHEPDASATEPNDAGDAAPDDVSGEDACTLDSGSPLLYTGASGRVVGVVSFGDKSNCGDPLRPSVYTEIAAFQDWLEEQTESTAFPLGDLGLEVSVTASGVTGGARSLRVDLVNGSTRRAFVAPTFTVQSSAVDLAYNSGSSTVSSCTEVNPDEFSCSVSGTLSAGASRTAMFTLSPADSSEQLTRLDIAVSSDPGQDFRSDNNVHEQLISFTDKPDIRLSNIDVVAIRAGNAGDVTVFVEIENVSAHVAATDVVLDIGPVAEEDYLLTSAVGATCTGELSWSCEVGGLSAGESVVLELLFDSDAATDGQLSLAASASNGDFPVTNLDDEPDASAIATVSFPELVRPSGGGGSGGGGQISLSFVLLLLLCRYRVHGGSKQPG